MKKNVSKKGARTRFAPSPTGYVHIGNLRTALYAYLFAKKNKGDFLLRIEDTDQKRFIDDATQRILDVLEWAGIEVDEGVMLEDGQIVEKGEKKPYIQSKRLELYKKYADRLIDEGKAYHCFCSSERLQELREDQQKKGMPPMYDKKCQDVSREEAEKRMKEGERCVVRMRVPENEIISFKDNVFGEMKVESNTIDDQVIIKSDGYPTYHLAVVVDDYLMKITHVIRGEDWLPSTPKHVLLYRFLDWETPEFIHLPNIINENRKKLSKRQGDVSVADFQQKGYLPEALINFLALLGWNPKTEEEIFSLGELEKKFDVAGIHKAGAVFDYKKLDWMNGHYIKQKKVDDLAELCKPYFQKYSEEQGVSIPDEIAGKIVAIEQDRMKKLSEITDNIDFYFFDPEYEKDLLQWKKMPAQEIREALEKMKKTVEGLEKLDDLEFIKKKLFDEADGRIGEHFWPLRVALTGKDKSPSPFEIIWVIGKDESIKRIEKAIKKIS